MGDIPRLFGTSGIRGPIGKKISAELALKVGRALSTSLGKNSIVVIGHDTRTSNKMLENSLTAGLLESGSNVIKLGMVPTPLSGYATIKLNADAGIMITASHNPSTDNGMKIWNKDGTAYSEEQEKNLEKIIHNNTYNTASWDEIGQISYAEEIQEDYKQKLLSMVDIKPGLKVVVDPGSGAGSYLSPFLLREAGCHVISLNSQPDGHFPGRMAEPKESNLQDLITIVKQTNADLGIAHDGDADRIAAVDEKGNMVDFDKLLALISRELSKDDEYVITTVDASACIDNAVGPGTKVMRSKVGDVHVAQLMKEYNAQFGGEPSGTWIHRDFCMCPDGILSGLRIAELISKYGPLSQQLEEMKSFSGIREKIPCPEEKKIPILKAVQEHINEEFSDITNINNIDGVRLTLEDGSWVLLRPSGTEAYMRVTLEGITPERAQELYKTSEQFIKKQL